MKRSPPRLGFYCPGNGTGGPWRYVHSILGAIDPDEFDVKVFCDLPGIYEPQPRVKLVRLSDNSVATTISVSVPTGQKPVSTRRFRFVPDWLRIWAGFAKESRRLAKLLRQHPVDLFHTQNTGCEESPVAARLAGIRRILGTFHVSSAIDLRRLRSGPVHRVLEQLSNRCLDVGIAVSEDTARDWVRRTHIPARRVETIFNGIDPMRFQRRRSRIEARTMLGLPTEGMIVGSLGRLDEAKGFEYLIAAAAMLRPEFPNLTVAIAGSGPLQSQLEAQAASLGIADRMLFLGFQSDVQLVLDALDVFAFPSVSETLGYALLEAMATELPTVGAMAGGIPEVIVEGETGFLVPKRDPRKLAERLRLLLLDGNLRMKLGAAGRARVISNFNEQEMVRKTIQIYRRALTRRPFDT